MTDDYSNQKALECSWEILRQAGLNRDCLPYIYSVLAARPEFRKSLAKEEE